MNKKEVFSYFDLTKTQIEKVDFYVRAIINQNQHMNLVGKSTIINIWDRHVLDCLQLTKFIKNKNLTILDMGTGAGLPGLLLSIVGYRNVLMVDSIKKKTDFIKKTIKDLSLSAKIQNKRIEKMQTSAQDIIISRALAPLSDLLTYALMHSNKNTTSLFLKGKNVNIEIEKAMNKFYFDFKKIESMSSGGGYLLKIKHIKTKNV